MKKVLIIGLIVATVGIFAPGVQARTSSAPAAEAGQLWSGQTYRTRRYNRRPRTVTRTRIVRVGYRRYRETIRVAYLPNGRIRTQVIRRVRIR